MEHWLRLLPVLIIAVLLPRALADAATYAYDESPSVLVDAGPDGSSPLSTQLPEVMTPEEPRSGAATTVVVARRHSLQVVAPSTAPPRFVAASDGIIDTASPALRQQIDDVADAVITTGTPPPGVRQGGVPGKPGVWGNRAGDLPEQPLGYYTETDVWPGPGPRGTERLVVGDAGEVWYTPDHYGTFRQVG